MEATTTPATPKTRLTAEERREQLLDVTREIAGERGFHAISIEAVAREAGITRPVVYGHFKDLNGLLEAMIDREGDRAVAQLAEVLPRDFGEGEDRIEMLIAALRGYLDAVRAEPVTWRLVLMPPEGAPERMRAKIAEGRSAVVAQLAVAMSAGFGPGRESPDPELTARSVSEFSDAMARLILTDPGNWPVERILDHTRWMLGQVAP
jgi:AcrR family transcriptional regulator